MPAALAKISDQATQSGVVGVLATIMQSGCTNTCGSTVAMHNEGSARADIIATTHSFVTEQEFPVGSIDTKMLQELLTEMAAEAGYRDW